jgi:hypothetical protein
MWTDGWNAAARGTPEPLGRDIRDAIFPRKGMQEIF